MNKFITKLAKLFLGMAMAAGVGVAVRSSQKTYEANAAEEVYKETIFNSTNNSGNVGNYTSTWTNTTNGFVVTLVNFNNNNNQWSYVKCGTNKGASTGTVKTNAAIDKAITKVSIKIGAITAGNVTSITLYSGASAGAKTTTLGTFSKATGDQSVTISSPATGKFYTIEAVCTKASSNGPLRIDNIKFYQNVSADPSVSILTPDLSKLPVGYAASTKLTANAEDFTNTVTYTWSIKSGSSYVEISSNGSECTVTSKTTNSSTGTATIQVSATDGTTTKTAEQAISIISVNSVAQSISAIGSGSGITGVFTHGYVNGYFKSGSGYTSDISEAAAIDGSGRAKFFISDDGSEGTASTRMEAYNCYDLNGTAFSALPEMGTEVVIYGDLSLYQSTYEINQNGFVVYKLISTITQISKSSDLTKDTYVVGEFFSIAGLAITGTISSGGTMDVTNLCTFSPANGAQLTQELDELTVTYSASNTPTTSTGSDIVITVQITVRYPSADTTIDLIDDIGTVVYTQECYDKIVAARASFDALPVQSQSNVTNYSDLEDAEAAFDDLILENVQNVEDLIDAISTVTLESGSAITAAESAYDDLLEGNLGKSLVNSAKYTALTSARSTYDAMVADKAAADAVTALITALPDASSISDYTYHSSIVAARTAYNNLTSSQKEYVLAATLAKLVACEEKDAQFAPLFFTIAYTDTTTTTNMSGGNDAYTVFGLDATVWSIVGAKGGNSNYPGLNKSKLIKLYANRSDGDGNEFTVTALNSSYTITTIEIDFKTEGTNTVSNSSGTITASDGVYTVNDSYFVIKNTQNSGSSNIAVDINSIVVNYTIEQAATADAFLDAVDAIPALANITSSNLDTVNSLIAAAEVEYSKLSSELIEDADVIAAKATLDAAKSKAQDVAYEVEAADTIALIADLPNPESINDYSHHSDILAARLSYNGLSDGAKSKVTNYSKLVSCESAESPYAPLMLDIDTDGGVEHSSDSGAPSTAFADSDAIEAAYPVNTNLIEWSSVSYVYGSDSTALKLGSGSYNGSITLSFTHDRMYATSVILDAKAWSTKTVTVSVNGVTHDLTGVNHLLTFDLSEVEFTGDVVITTTTTAERRLTVYGISVEYDYRADYKSASSFENEYVKKNIAYPETVPTGIDTHNCLSVSKGGQGYFDDAMDYYNDSLSSEARLEFATHDDFSNARERLQAWARANGKELSFNTTNGSASITPAGSRLFTTFVSSNNSVVIIVIISMVSMTAIGGYFFLRKRKENI